MLKNTRRQLAFLALLSAFLALPVSCKTGGIQDGGTTVLRTIESCADEATHSTALHIVDDVATAIATGDWVGNLEKLAVEWGQAAVSCAIAQVVGTAEHNFAASGDDLERVKAERGRQYLAQHPVPVPGAPQPGK